jgi:hypothetical protein
LGYQHYIGEAYVWHDMDERRARIQVEVAHVDDDANWLCTGYSEWMDFTRRTGLHQMFYGQKSGEYDDYKPWWRDDEGVYHDDLIWTTQYSAKLTEGHYRGFVQARDSYPKYTTSAHREDDFVFLAWLIKWTRWALDNCTNPTYYNG